MHLLKKTINGLEEWTLTLVLLGLAFLTFVQVICRYVLDFSFSWSEEVARYLGVFITFLGAALGVKYGFHFSMDLVYEKVRSDRFRQVLQVVVNLLSGILFLVVAWYGFEQTMKLRQYGVLTAVLQLPKYWAYLPVPVFSIVIAVRFFILSAKYGKQVIRRETFKMIKDTLH
jgi:C4-dicarboxylate transporter DctQ subunit